MIRILTLCLAAITAAAVISPRGAQGAEQTIQKRDVKPQTQAFLKKAAEMQEAQIALGQLAAQRATNIRVKNFGEEMILVHRVLSLELRELTGPRGVQLSMELDDEHKRVLKKLAQLSGYAFDGNYMEQIMGDHQNHVNEFEENMHKVDDAEVLRWAHKALPTLRAHIEEARWILQSLQTNP